MNKLMKLHCGFGILDALANIDQHMKLLNAEVANRLKVNQLDPKAHHIAQFMHSVHCEILDLDNLKVVVARFLQDVMEDATESREDQIDRIFQEAMKRHGSNDNAS